MENYEQTAGRTLGHLVERLPLGFEDYEQFHQFKDDCRKVIEGLKVNGESISALMRQTGTGTTFYSENPYRPLGHHFDKLRLEGKLSDIDICLFSPELLRKII